MPAYRLDDTHAGVVLTAVVEGHVNGSRGLMRTSGSLERNDQWQRRCYRLAHAVRLGNGHPLTADADAIGQRRAWVQMIALGEVQVDQNLPCRTSLDLLRRDLDDFV